MEPYPTFIVYDPCTFPHPPGQNYVYDPVSCTFSPHPDDGSDSGDYPITIPDWLHPSEVPTFLYVMGFLGYTTPPLDYMHPGGDSVPGGDGDDTIGGNGGADVLGGGDGNDLLYGDDGADYVWGEAGDDTIVGGEAYDMLVGGLGNDLLVGGADRRYILRAGRSGYLRRHRRGQLDHGLRRS